MLDASPICSSRTPALGPQVPVLPHLPRRAERRWESGSLSLDSTALASVAVWQSRPSVKVILGDTTAAGAMLEQNALHVKLVHQ